MVILADNPFDFDTSVKVKIIAMQCSLVPGKKQYLVRGLLGRNGFGSKLTGTSAAAQCG